MNKRAKTKYEIIEILAQRWSPRAFSDKAIESEKLKRIFEAARWSPSANNSQPWSFIVGIKDNDNTYDKIYSTFVEFNQLWTKFAPVLIISCGTTDFNNRQMYTYSYDVGQSVAYLTVQATSEGLFVHQMSGFDRDKTKELFNLPENVEPISAIAIGYIGNPDILNEKLKLMEMSERVRKDFDKFIFTEKFSQSLDL